MRNKFQGPGIKPSYPFVMDKDSPQSQGLIGWWPGADAAGGNAVFDLSGYGNHLRPPGGSHSLPLLTANGPDGGNAMSFDGNLQMVVAANASLYSFEFTKPFSLSTWIRTSRGLTSGYAMTKIGASVNFPGYRMGLTSVTVYSFIVAATSASLISVTTPKVADGLWQLFTTTYNGNGLASGCKLYVNGRPGPITVVSDTLSGASILNNSAFEINGGNGGGNLPLKGQQDDCRVYNRVLTDAEVFSMWEPSTRWSLRYVPGRKTYLFGAPPPPSTFKPYYVPTNSVVGVGIN